MNRVSRRASALLLLVAILLGGLGFFIYEYVTKASTWVISPGSPHIYNSSNIGFGTVYDRNGVVLLDIGQTRQYASDLSVRMSTLHWLGDRKGQISAPAIANYAKEMAGFDTFDGLYSYGDAGGQAVLTLSAKVQATALEALGDRKGTVGVYNYKTGQILCAVTSPTYDPDDVPDIEADTTGEYEGIYLNRFVQSAYVPGSIFKLVTTAAALDHVEGIESMEFQCKGIYEYGIDKVTCEKAHGKVNLKTALAKSCNCAFGQIANLVGGKTLQEYAQQLKITEKVTFDGVTTAAGNFDVANAAPVQVAWGGIGQHTDLVNPCRYMMYMGAIAGGGRTAQPYLVAGIYASDECTYEASTTYTEQLLPKETARTLKEYMENNVNTVYGADHFPGLTVCAKSGTSQLGGEQISNAMFAGFVADDEYPLAFIVVIENGGYGSSTCVPVLSQVLAVCKAEMDGK